MVSPSNTYEKLRRIRNGKLNFIYKYVIVIEYNVNPVKKVKEALFLSILREVPTVQQTGVSVFQKKRL